MKFFIDTANLNEIKEAHDLGVLDGVTTNPSLMAKEGIKGKDNIKAHYKAICNIVDNNVSAEVIATDFETIIKEGRELARIDDKIVVKVPMIKDGVKAIKREHPHKLYIGFFSRTSNSRSESRRQLRFSFYRATG
jgi:transaldolase